MRIFGCHAYAYVKDGKLDPRAIKSIFLRYVVGVKGYRLWYTKKDRIPRFIISKDVIFDESTMFDKKKELDESVGKINRGAN